MNTEPASSTVQPNVLGSAAHAVGAQPESTSAGPLLAPRWMLPIATGLLGVIVGVFVTSMARKPLPVETRFLNFDVPSMGRLRAGWSRPEALPDGTSFAWCAAKSCSVSLTSHATGDRVIAFHADPFRFPGAPTQIIEASLNGTSLGSKKLVHGAVARFPAARAQWRPGDNELRFDFGYAEAPREKTPQNRDERHLSASFHWLVVADAPLSKKP